MSYATASTPLFALQLQATQRAWEYLPKGAAVVVSEGAVRLHRREYLAGMWLDVPVLLRVGDRHQVAAAGWVEIEAVGAARIQAQQAAWGIGRWWRSALAVRNVV